MERGQAQDVIAEKEGIFSISFLPPSTFPGQPGESGNRCLHGARDRSICHWPVYRSRIKMLSRSYLTLGGQKPSSLPVSGYAGWSIGVCMVGWLEEPPEGVGRVIFRLWRWIQCCPLGHPSPYPLQFHCQEVLV